MNTRKQLKGIKKLPRNVMTHIIVCLTLSFNRFLNKNDFDKNHKTSFCILFT